MRCRGKPPSEWAVSWPRRSKSSTKKPKKQRGVPSQPARYSLEFFPYGSCLGQTKSPKIQFAKKVMESKRKPSDSQRNPRASGRSAGIRTRGLLVPNQARYQTSPHPEKTEGKEKERAAARPFRLEAPPRFELGHQDFADPCLTTWLWRRTIYYIQKEVL